MSARKRPSASPAADPDRSSSPLQTPATHTQRLMPGDFMTVPFASFKVAKWKGHMQSWQAQRGHRSL